MRPARIKRQSASDNHQTRWLSPGLPLNQTRVHNKVNEIDVDDDHSNSPGASITGTPNWADPKYDAAGNITTLPTPSSPNQSYATLKYDAWNRLVSFGDPLTTVFEYDGLGQRIRKAPANSSTNFHYYYNDQWQLLTESTVTSGTETVLAIYHWHPFYVDALATRMRASDTHFFLHDANFNVTAAVSDSTDAVVERYRYSPYGDMTVLNADFSLDSSGGGDGLSDIGNQHLYTGRERDPESGLQLNRHRYYASHLGRWLTRDLIGYLGMSMNLYGYGGSNPLSNTDPTGEAWYNPCDWYEYWFPAVATQGPTGATEIAGALEAGPPIIRIKDVERCRQRWIDSIGTPKEKQRAKEYEECKKKHAQHFDDE